MRQKDAYEKIIREYLGKCKCCDECIASYYCTVNRLRNSRTPQNYCVDNLKEYLRKGVNYGHNTSN